MRIRRGSKRLGGRARIHPPGLFNKKLLLNLEKSPAQQVEKLKEKYSEAVKMPQSSRDRLSDEERYRAKKPRVERKKQDETPAKETGTSKERYEFFLRRRIQMVLNTREKKGNKSTEFTDEEKQNLRDLSLRDLKREELQQQRTGRLYDQKLNPAMERKKHVEKDVEKERLFKLRNEEQAWKAREEERGRMRLAAERESERDADGRERRQRYREIKQREGTPSKINF